MEKIIRNIRSNTNGTIFNRTSQCLAFADDVVILGRSVKYINDTVKDMSEVAEQIGLSINSMKTKYMRNKQESTENMDEITIKINNQNYERVNSFKYLGTEITSANDIETEIKARLSTANKAYYAFQTLFKKRYISRSLKVQIYKTVIRPIAIYGAESWTLTKKSEELVRIWERKILRKIYGPTCDNGLWRMKMNHELYDKFKSPDIIAIIKVRRLEWLGHVMRMQNQRTAKKILEGKPEGRRRIGRPRLRWLDDVEADLREMGVKRWRKKAVDRQEWASILKEAKAKLKGL